MRGQAMGGELGLWERSVKRVSNHQVNNVKEKWTGCGREGATEAVVTEQGQTFKTKKHPSHPQIVFTKKIGESVS